MSVAELERLVEAAEADGTVRQSLRQCRSRRELVFVARQLGYRITRIDLDHAVEADRQEQRIRRLNAQCTVVSLTDPADSADR